LYCVITRKFRLPPPWQTVSVLATIMPIVAIIDYLLVVLMLLNGIVVRELKDGGR